MEQSHVVLDLLYIREKGTIKQLWNSDREVIELTWEYALQSYASCYFCIPSCQFVYFKFHDFVLSQVVLLKPSLLQYFFFFFCIDFIA